MAFVSLTFGGWKGSLTTSSIYSIKIRLFKLCMFIESSFINCIFLTTYTFHLVLKINLHIVIQYNFKIFLKSFCFDEQFPLFIYFGYLSSPLIIYFLRINFLFSVFQLSQYLSLVISSIYFTLFYFVGLFTFFLNCMFYLFVFILLLCIYNTMNFVGGLLQLYSIDCEHMSVWVQTPLLVAKHALVF